MNLAAKARLLLEQQKSEWELLRRGYESLDGVRTREFDLDGSVVRLQFNPGRMASSSAKVDEKSIQQRPCFLCPGNLPKEQRGIACGDGFTLLCNPFPIFPEHFTIPHTDHRPQRILENFGSMLRLARDLADGFVVFYNGPRCGASAPDHLHFQAGSKGFMPIDTSATSVYSVPALQRFMVIESRDPAHLFQRFGSMHRAMQDHTGESDEPMMNVLAYHQNDSWRVIVFPRARHRPSFYFADGDAKLLLSPGAVDLGGVVISPVERDFQRITQDHLLRMYEEVTWAQDAFDRLRRVVS